MSTWSELAHGYVARALPKFESKTYDHALFTGADPFDAVRQGAISYLTALVSPGLWDLQTVYHQARRTVDPSIVKDNSMPFFEDLEKRRVMLAKPKEILDEAIARFGSRAAAGAARFVARTASDFPLLTGGAKPDLSIAAVDSPLSDPHEDHCGAIGIHLSDGAYWFYKPRSGHMDCTVASFLMALEAIIGSRLSIRTPSIVDCGTYHWSRGVVAEPIETEAQLRQYCDALGQACALAMMFSVTDLHLENLIFAGNLFILDVETFFANTLREPPARDIVQTHRHRIESDLISTSLLPYWRIGRFEKKWDFSPLGSRGEFESDSFVFDDRSDESTTEWRFWRFRNTVDSLGLSDLAFGTLAADAFAAGFRQIYTALVTHREEVLRLVAELDVSPSRVVLRPTQTYWHLQTQSFHPRVLFGLQSRRDLLREQLDVTDSDEHWHPAAIRDHEAKNLADLAVPIFFSEQDGTSLRYDGGRDETYFVQTARSDMHARIAGASMDDLDFLEEIIRRSFAERFG